MSTLSVLGLAPKALVLLLIDWTQMYTASYSKFCLIITIGEGEFDHSILELSPKAFWRPSKRHRYAPKIASIPYSLCLCCPMLNLFTFDAFPLNQTSPNYGQSCRRNADIERLRQRFVICHQD